MRSSVAAMMAASVLVVLPASAEAFSGFKGRFGGVSRCPQTDVPVCGQYFTLPQQTERSSSPGDYEPGKPGRNAGSVSLIQGRDNRWVAKISETTPVRKSRASYQCNGGQWQIRQKPQCEMSVKWGTAWGERVVMSWDFGEGKGTLHPSSKTEGSGRTFVDRVPKVDANLVCGDGGDVQFHPIRKRYWSKRLGKKKDHSNQIWSLQVPTCRNGLTGMVRVWDTTRNSGNTSYDVTGHITYRVVFE